MKDYLEIIAPLGYDIEVESDHGRIYEKTAELDLSFQVQSNFIKGG